MSKPDMSLGNLKVALSGAVPDLEDLRERGWSELDIRFAVTGLTQQLFDRGAHVVHGNHPTYLPLIEGVARQFPGRESRVTIVTSNWFFSDRVYGRNGPTSESFERRHGDYANVLFTPAVATREESLTLMRQALIDASNAVVCIGGRLHKDTGTPGIDEEIGLAVKANLAVYLLGSFGGAVTDLFDRKFRNNDYPLRNELRASESEILATTQDPTQATTLVLEGLQRVATRQRG